MGLRRTFMKSSYLLDNKVSWLQEYAYRKEILDYCKFLLYSEYFGIVLQLILN